MPVSPKKNLMYGKGGKKLFTNPLLKPVNKAWLKLHVYYRHKPDFRKL